MSLTFPRDMTSGYDWARADLALVHRQEMSRTAGGDLQAKDLGPAVWQADYATVPMTAAEARGYYADLLTLRAAAQTLYVATIPNAPAARVAETLTGVSVASLAASNDAIALAGLPAGFVMTAGDYLSIETAGGARELHMLARGGSADGTGTTPELEVVPHVRPGVAQGDAVTLLDPLLEMRLQPESLRHERLNSVLSRVAFKALQVIR